MRVAIIDSLKPLKPVEIGPIQIGSANKPEVGDKVMLYFDDGRCLGFVTSVSGVSYEDWTYKAMMQAG